MALRGGSLRNKLLDILENKKAEDPGIILDSILPIIDAHVKKITAGPSNKPKMELRDLEDFLVILRDLKSKYENLDSKTGQDMIRIDELRQLEFKITELIFEYRNK